MRKIGFGVLLLLTISLNSFAGAAIKWVNTEKVVPNLEPVITELKQNSKIPVIFPKQIPQPEQQQLYAQVQSYYQNPDYNKFWSIDLIQSPDCNVKSCVIGSMIAEEGGVIDKTYEAAPFNNNTTQFKQAIKLTPEITAYFTPSHAGADWWNPMLEWQNENIKYTLTWVIKGNEKPALIRMAQSALSTIHHVR